MSITADRINEAQRAAELAARQSYGRLVAYLAARSRDLAGAEDALAEAFAAALAQWPRNGVPHNPEAWLLSVARRRQIDAIRRRKTADARQEHLAMLDDERATAHPSDIPDERLRLMFACAHPAIDPGIRAPLILQTVLGIDAAAIGAAYLTPAPTMAQRLVRAKTRIREAGIPFRVPDQSEMPERLDAVLVSIYSAFTEGWIDADGANGKRRQLATEAIWLGRLLVSLLPQEPETHGLLALMLYAEARRPARRGPGGQYVPLADQEVSLWSTMLIEEAEMLLGRANKFGPTGRFQLEAAVQSAHCARRLTGNTDWSAIRSLYDALVAIVKTPVAALNRAVAIAETGDLPAAIDEMQKLAADARLHAYQPYWAARAELMRRSGHVAEAHQAYERAILLTDDAAARDFMEQRRATLVN